MTLSSDELRATLRDAFLAKDQKLMDAMLVELVLAGESVERIGTCAVTVLDELDEQTREYWYNDCSICGTRHLGPT